MSGLRKVQLSRGRGQVKKVLQRLMNDHGWIDIFRERGGDIKRYTWRNNGPVVKQARLDYFIISRSWIPQVSDVSILPGYRTDHSIVALKMCLLNQKRGKGFFLV